MDATEKWVIVKAFNDAYIDLTDDYDDARVQSKYDGDVFILTKQVTEGYYDYYETSGDILVYEIPEHILSLAQLKCEIENGDLIFEDLKRVYL